MRSLRIFQHVLPNAKAWRLTAQKKLRSFFEGLAGTINDIKQMFDLVWLDIDPKVTRELDQWEVQFGITPNAATEQERRDRLAAAWSAVGGQSPRYLQDTLQANGFDVYVHDAWDLPRTVPATYKNPSLFLSGGATIYLNECGEALAECGEVQAEAGERSTPPGYSLVNKFSGAPTYVLPADPLKYPFFLYIGGAVFGVTAQVDSLRRTEFEDLCLKLCPTQLWLGLLIEYN